MYDGVADGVAGLCVGVTHGNSCITDINGISPVGVKVLLVCMSLWMVYSFWLSVSSVKVAGCVM